MGMTIEEYWHCDTSYFKYYRKAYQIKRERENERLWVQGMYVYDAICCCVPVLRAFSKAKKPTQYPKEPYPFYEKSNKKVKGEKKPQIDNDAKAKMMMDIFMVNINKKFADKESKQEAKKNG